MRIPLFLKILVKALLMALRTDDQLPAKRYSLGPVETYELERDKFDSIEGEATGIGTSSAFAFACIPVAVTLSVTLMTVPITNPSIAMSVWALMWTCYILGGFFGISAWRQRGRLKRFMDRIRERQIPPVAAKITPAHPDLIPISDPNATPTAAGTPSPADVEET